MRSRGTVAKQLAVGAVKGLPGLQSMRLGGKFGKWLTGGPRGETRYFALASKIHAGRARPQGVRHGPVAGQDLSSGPMTWWYRPTVCSARAARGHSRLNSKSCFGEASQWRIRATSVGSQREPRTWSGLARRTVGGHYRHRVKGLYSPGVASGVGDLTGIPTSSDYGLSHPGPEGRAARRIRGRGAHAVRRVRAQLRPEAALRRRIVT